jgi:DNA-binding transcriptional LysR family regulator
MAKAETIIGNRIKLQHLKVLIAVAESGSMAKAAKHLAISQPVVSKVIATIEEILGVSLFDRSPQGVEPTRYGRALIKRSAAVFDDLKTAVDELKFLADPTTGELLIGTTEPLALFSAAVIDRLSLRYPGIIFRVEQADSAVLMGRDLPERRIELAIVPLLRPVPADELEAKVLFHDRLRVVVGKKSRWSTRSRIALAELTDEAWCVAPSLLGTQITQAFAAEGLGLPRIAIETTTAPIFFQLIESGRFIGHFGDGLLRFYADRFAVKQLPIDLPVPFFSVAIITVKNRTISPVAELFINCAQELARPLARRQLLNLAVSRNGDPLSK